MFVRDHLAVVAHWARDQLREGVESHEVEVQLQRLIAAAEVLRAELPAMAMDAENVVRLNAHRSAYERTAHYI